MQRKFLVFCFALLIVAPTSGWALGLGRVTVKSSLNQPLLAEIPILSARSRDLDVMTVKLASPEMFERANIKRSLFLSQLKFELDKETSPPIVRIRSRSNITEPFVTLILELNWANGRIMREFTLMLDPPRGVPMPRGRDRPARQLSSTGRVATRPARQEQPTREFAARPTARAGSRLGTDYGTVRSGQTLWQIAKEVKGSESMTTEQLVMALYRTNPEAFSQKNINALLAGRRLRVPTADEVKQESAQKASAEFREQVRAWRRGVAATTAEAAPTAAEKRAAQAQAAGQPTSTAQQAQTTSPAEAQQAARPRTATTAARPEDTQVGPRLQVLAPTDVGGSAGDSESAKDLPENVDVLKSALLQAQDEADRARIEREQQTSRMEAMQGRLALLERLVTLKDQELASIQQQSAQTRGLTVSAEDKDQEAAATETETEAATPATAAAQDKDSTPTKPKVEDTAQLVAPSPAISPRVIEDESSAIDFIWNNPKVWLIALVIMLLVFFLIWMFVRSMLGKEEVYEETDLAEKIDRMSAKAAEMEKLAAEAADAETDASLTKDNLAPPPAPSSENPFTRNRSTESLASSSSASSPSVDGGAQLSETELDDVLKEVKVFLNYGRQDHAINFLVKLIESYPEEVKPRLALLRLAHDMKRQDLFAEQAQALWDRLDDRTGPEWLEVAELGQKFLPDHPLFCLASPYDSTSDDDFNTDQHEILTFDLPGESRQEKEDSLSSKAEPVLFGNNEFEFDESLFTEDPLAIKKDDNAADVDASGDAESDGEDSVAVRLDLAKNYVEMGDVDGAIEVIKDVLKRGTPDQIDEASRLLLSLDLS